MCIKKNKWLKYVAGVYMIKTPQTPAIYIWDQLNVGVA